MTTESQHVDKLGRTIEVGDYVICAISSKLMIGQVDRLLAKKIEILDRSNTLTDFTPWQRTYQSNIMRTKKSVQRVGTSVILLPKDTDLTMALLRGIIKA